VKALVAVAVAAVVATTASRPARSEVVVGLLGDGTHLGGIQAGGVDAYVDVATQLSPRLELFGLGGLGYLAVGVVDAAQSGVQARLAAGVRWRPLTWGDATDGIDLYIEAGGGANASWWDGHALARPDADLGWGFQVRTTLGRRKLLLRSGVQALISSDSSEPTFVCRGCTLAKPQAVDGGLLGVMGVSL
jgi:prepilin-type processing-associated H-X9-DG protein